MTEIHWDPLVYHQNCAASVTMTAYNVTITSLNLGGQSETSITFTSSGNSADISNVLLNQEYTASVAIHQIVTLTGGNQRSRTCYIEYPEIILTISNKNLQDPNGIIIVDFDFLIKLNSIRNKICHPCACMHA